MSYKPETAQWKQLSLLEMNAQFCTEKVSLARRNVFYHNWATEGEHNASAYFVIAWIQQYHGKGIKQAVETTPAALILVSDMIYSNRS